MSHLSLKLNTKMIDVVQHVRCEVDSNRDSYPDWDRILMLCEYIELLLNLKITEVIEDAS